MNFTRKKIPAMSLPTHPWSESRGSRQPELSKDGDEVTFRRFSVRNQQLPAIRKFGCTEFQSDDQKNLKSMMSAQRVSSNVPLRLHVTNLPFRFR